jgi:hypothetical protein
VITPLMTLAVLRFGAIGAPIAWIALNASYVAFMIPAMHRRLLRGETRRWYVQDVGLPLLAALPTIAASRLLMPRLSSPLASLTWLAVTGVAAVAAAAFAMPFTRQWIATAIRSIR